MCPLPAVPSSRCDVVKLYFPLQKDNQTKVNDLCLDERNQDLHGKAEIHFAPSVAHFSPLYETLLLFCKEGTANILCKCAQSDHFRSKLDKFDRVIHNIMMHDTMIYTRSLGMYL